MSIAVPSAGSPDLPPFPGMTPVRGNAPGAMLPDGAQEEACPVCDSSCAWTMMACGEVSVVPVCTHHSQPMTASQQGGAWPMVAALSALAAFVSLVLLTN